LGEIKVFIFGVIVVIVVFYKGFIVGGGFKGVGDVVN